MTPKAPEAQTPHLSLALLLCPPTGLEILGSPSSPDWPDFPLPRPPWAPPASGLPHPLLRVLPPVLAWGSLRRPPCQQSVDPAMWSFFLIILVLLENKAPEAKQSPRPLVSFMQACGPLSTSWQGLTSPFSDLLLDICLWLLPLQQLGWGGVCTGGPVTLSRPPPAPS